MQHIPKSINRNEISYKSIQCAYKHKIGGSTIHLPHPTHVLPGEAVWTYMVIMYMYEF